MLGKAVDSTASFDSLFLCPFIGTVCTPAEGSRDADCFKTKTDVKIYHTEGDTDDFAPALAGAIALAQNEGLLNVAGLEDIAGIEATETDTGGGGAGIIEGEGSNDDDGLGPAGIVLISVSAVALVLAALFLVNRRRNSSQLSHVYLDDDGSVMKDIGDEDTDTSSQKTRQAHVLGEEDSIASAWTGQRQDGTGYGNGYVGPDQSSLRKTLSTHDVHTCNSSLCEICEMQRKSDPTFIVTGTPSPPPRLPSDAAREYLAEDTVDL